MNEHKQVKINWFNGKTIEVDEGLAELISLCVHHEIVTVLSCQENRPGIAWICFNTGIGAARFIDIIARHPKCEKIYKTFYGRIFGFGSSSDWEYSTCIVNFNEQIEFDNDDEISAHKFIGVVDSYFNISIRFPITDIPKIIKRLKTAN